LIYQTLLYGGKLWSGKIWQIIFQTTFGEIKKNLVSHSVECAPSYIIALQTMMPAAPLVKLIEAFMPCSEARLPTLYLWAGVNTR